MVKFYYANFLAKTISIEDPKDFNVLNLTIDGEWVYLTKTNESFLGGYFDKLEDAKGYLNEKINKELNDMKQNIKILQTRLEMINDKNYPECF